MKKATVAYKDVIRLDTEDGPNFGRIRDLAVTDSSFLMAYAPCGSPLSPDSHLLRAVYEFSHAGKYLRTIGEFSRGESFEDSTYPERVWVDYEGNIYVYESNRGNIEMYNSKGELIGKLTQDILGFTTDVQLDRDGNLLQLANDNGIVRLNKFAKADFNLIYSTELSTPETNTIVYPLGLFFGFCYHNNDRIFYLLPTDHKIKEIDAQDGQILREFGTVPPNYRPLKSKYYNQGIVPPEQFDVIMQEITLVWNNIYLLKNRYLLVAHAKPFEGSTWSDEHPSWLLYDIQSKGEGVCPLNDSFLTRDKVYASRGDYLYACVAPSEEESEYSNGHIEIFSIEVE